MMKISLRLSLSIFLLFALPSVAQQPSVGGIVGKPAPAWDVSTWHQLPDGAKDLDVADYKGKVTYLYFFQSWCPGCHSVGFPRLQKLVETFGKEKDVGFAVIQTTFEGHRINTAAKLKPTAERYKLKIPFGQSAGDDEPPIMRKYRSRGTPWCVIIDKKGVVRYNGFHIEVDAASKLINELRAEGKKPAEFEKSPEPSTK